MGKVKVVSLDYDGCGFVLEPRNMVGEKVGEVYKVVSGEIKHPTKKHHVGFYTDDANKYPGFSYCILQIRQALIDFMLQDHEQYSALELYVGSNRQCAKLDILNSIRNLSISCFKVYSEFAKSTIFALRPVLYADVAHGHSQAPVAMAQALSGKEEALECEYEVLKIEIVLSQLEDIARNHPDAEIEFVFIDDDNENIIIPALQKAISAAYKDPERKKHLPQDIVIKLQKFDFYNLLPLSERVSEEAVKDKAHLQKWKDFFYSLANSLFFAQLSFELTFSSKTAFYDTRSAGKISSEQSAKFGLFSPKSADSIEEGMHLMRRRLLL